MTRLILSAKKYTCVYTSTRNTFNNWSCIRPQDAKYKTLNAVVDSFI